MRLFFLSFVTGEDAEIWALAGGTLIEVTTTATETAAKTETGIEIGRGVRTEIGRGVRTGIGRRIGTGIVIVIANQITDGHEVGMRGIPDGRRGIGMTMNVVAAGTDTMAMKRRHGGWFSRR